MPKFSSWFSYYYERKLSFSNLSAKYFGRSLLNIWKSTQFFKIGIWPRTPIPNWKIVLDDFRFMAAIILIEINNFLLIFAAELQKFAGILISLGQNFDNFFPRTFFFSIVDATMSSNSKHKKMFSKMSPERKNPFHHFIKIDWNKKYENFSA